MICIIGEASKRQVIIRECYYRLINRAFSGVAGMFSMHEVVGRSWMMLQGLDLVECICKRRKSDFPFIRVKKKRLFQDLTIFFSFFYCFYIVL